MAIFMVSKSKFYEENLIDLWGIHRFYFRKSRAMTILKYIRVSARERRRYYKSDYVFTYMYRPKWHRIKPKKGDFVQRHFLKNYYFLPLRIIAKQMIIAGRKIGSYIKNFLNFLEQRVTMLAFRTGFITNLFIIRTVIHHGIFCINGVVQTVHNVVVKPGDFFHVSLKYKDLIYNDLILRLKRKNIAYRAPRYLHMNYHFMYAFIIRYPKKKDVRYPYKGLDVHLAKDFFFP